MILLLLAETDFNKAIVSFCVTLLWSPWFQAVFACVCHWQCEVTTGASLATKTSQTPWRWKTPRVHPMEKRRSTKGRWMFSGRAETHLLFPRWNLCNGRSPLPWSFSVPTVVRFVCTGQPGLAETGSEPGVPSACKCTVLKMYCFFTASHFC